MFIPSQKYDPAFFALVAGLIEIGWLLRDGPTTYSKNTHTKSNQEGKNDWTAKESNKRVDEARRQINYGAIWQMGHTIEPSGYGLYIDTGWWAFA